MQANEGAPGRPEQPSEERLHPPETSPGLSAPLELEVLTPAAGQPPLSLRAEDSEEADEEGSGVHAP